MLEYVQTSWLQTKQELINNADLVVLMSPNVFEDAQAKYTISEPFRVWNIDNVEIPEGKTPQDYN